MNREIPFPRFFLVGAPRCGTTAMSYYLRAHPQVCFSDPKEPHFFSLVWRKQPPRDLRTEYLERCFGAYDPLRHRVLCEGSVSYLYDPSALERILALEPRARFLVMVRDPFEMLPSYHQRLLYILEEDVTSFEEAWRLQGARERGEHVPPRCTDPALLRYAEIGRLGARVSELFERVGRERCHVVVFDDLIAAPREVYLGVLDFLGVEDDGRDVFPRRQRGRSYRSQLLQRVVFKPPAAVAKRIAIAGVGTRVRSQRGAQAWLMRARKRLVRRNKQALPAPPLTPEMQQALRSELAADVELLGKLLRRDLSGWLGARPSAPALPHGAPLISPAPPPPFPIPPG